MKARTMSPAGVLSRNEAVTPARARRRVSADLDMIYDFARISIFAASIAASRGSFPGGKGLLEEIGQVLVSKGGTRADPDGTTWERFKGFPQAPAGKKRRERTPPSGGCSGRLANPPS